MLLRVDHHNEQSTVNVCWIYSLSGTTCTNSGDAKGGIGSTTSGPIIDTSSTDPDNNITSIPQDVLVSLKFNGIYHN